MLTKGNNRMIDGAAVNVRDFGAIGDGITDDTVAIQAAIDKVNTKGSGVVNVPSGIYLVQNLTVYNNITIRGESRESTTIKAATGGDDHYLIQTSSYPSGNYSNGRIHLESISLDGEGFKEFCVAFRTWNSEIRDCQIYQSTEADVYIPTRARDGTDLGFTMVNNRIVGCWIGVDQGTTKKNVWVHDPINKATDMHILDNFISSASEYNIQIETCAGLYMSGNHMYGAATSMYFLRPGLGTVITDNYFEGGLLQDNMLSSDVIATFGPGNFVRGDFQLNFGNAGTNIRSVNNTYQGVILHNYFSAEKIFSSDGDVFSNTNPFTFHNSTSSGQIKVNNAYLAAEDLYISSQFSGNKAGWKRPVAVTYGSVSQYIRKGAALATGPETASITIPWTAEDNFRQVDFTLNSRLNWNSTVRTSYFGRVMMLTRGSTGGNAITVISEDITPAQFTSAPAYSFIDNGDGTGTFSVTWDPADADGYGGWVLKITD